MSGVHELLTATVAAERMYRDLAAAHDRLVVRVETLEETVSLLTQVINQLVDDGL